MAQYLTELTLIEHRMLIYPPSKIAASALSLAILILYNDQSNWTPKLRYHTNYDEQDLRACQKDMCILYRGIE